MGRKTIEVEVVKRRINGRLDSPMTSREQRWELILLLEGLLRQTDNYQGFTHLPDAQGDDSRRSYR